MDTGASAVSLPASLIPVLGIPEESLQPGQFKTANGTVDGSLGTLPAVWLNQARIADVAVAFLDDERISATSPLAIALLGARTGHTVWVDAPTGAWPCEGGG